MKNTVMRFTAIRRLRGMSLSSLSIASGINVSMLSRMEHFKQQPTEKHLLAIADALDWKDDVYRLLDVIDPMDVEV